MELESLNQGGSNCQLDIKFLWVSLNHLGNNIQLNRYHYIPWNSENIYLHIGHLDILFLQHWLVDNNALVYKVSVSYLTNQLDRSSHPSNHLYTIHLSIHMFLHSARHDTFAEWMFQEDNKILADIARVHSVLLIPMGLYSSYRNNQQDTDSDILFLSQNHMYNLPYIRVVYLQLILADTRNQVNKILNNIHLTIPAFCQIDPQDTLSAGYFLLDNSFQSDMVLILYCDLFQADIHILEGNGEGRHL
jgi:hypothetical protein